MTGRLQPDTPSESVLILAPTGRDAQVIAEVLAGVAVGTETCRSMQQLVSRLSEDAGAVLLAEEALESNALALLVDALGHQPPWSDIPILVSAAQGPASEGLMRALQLLELSGIFPFSNAPSARRR